MPRYKYDIFNDKNGASHFIIPSKNAATWKVSPSEVHWTFLIVYIKNAFRSRATLFGLRMISRPLVANLNGRSYIGSRPEDEEENSIGRHCFMRMGSAWQTWERKQWPEWTSRFGGESSSSNKQMGLDWTKMS